MQLLEHICTLTLLLEYVLLIATNYAQKCKIGRISYRYIDKQSKTTFKIYYY